MNGWFQFAANLLIVGATMPVFGTNGMETAECGTALMAGALRFVLSLQEWIPAVKRYIRENSPPPSVA